MALAELDSRALLGTDIEPYPNGPSGTDSYILYPKKRTVRVILAQLGRFVRVSAPELDVVAEGSNQEQAWAKFLAEITERFEPDESAWMSFDVGPTRREEIQEGLNAPEDEDWSEPVSSDEG